MLHGHGDDRYAFNKPIRADFSSNVIAENFPEELGTILAKKLPDCIRYPEPNAESLQRELAEFHNLQDNQVLVTNGSVEAFYLIAQCFEHQTALIPQPTFAEYGDACRVHHIETHFLPWDELHPHSINIPARQQPADLLFLCNPNNPTGSVIPVNDLRQLLSVHPQTTFVIDEANTELTDASVSAVDLLSEFSNLVITRSLTKTFAIPGLRLGYILANEAFITRLLSLKMPWSVNTLAIEAGRYIIAHHRELLPDIHELRARTQNVIRQINEIDGLEVMPTQTNYFLVRLHRGTAPELKSWLIQHYGILIRDASNFEGLDHTWIRISTGTEDENRHLINALQAWSSSVS